MARDESRDVWIGWLTLETLFERAIKSPRGAATTAGGIVATVALGETDEDAMATRYVPHDQLEALQGELNAWREDANHQLERALCFEEKLEAAERERDASREAQNELRDVLRTTCCSWTALINSARELVALWEAANKRIAELEQEFTLARRVDNWCAKTPCPDCPPRCKDGCGHWRPPLGGEYQNAACAHGYGMYQPKPDGSGFCVDHTRLKP